MFQIGEFSNYGQVTPRMLRHYDKIGLLKPGIVDEDTGYRYYRPEQLTLLHKISALKGLGVTLEEMKDIIHNKADDVSYLHSLLQKKKMQLEADIEMQHAMLSNIEARINQIDDNYDFPYDIVIKKVNPLIIASIRDVVPGVGEMPSYCKKLHLTLYNELKQSGIHNYGDEFVFYHNKEYSENDIQMEVAVEVFEEHRITNSSVLAVRQLPELEKAASLVITGDFEEIPNAVMTLLNWSAVNGYHFSPPLRELHLSGKAHDARGNTAKSPVIELQLPLEQDE